MNTFKIQESLINCTWLFFLVFFENIKYVCPYFVKICMNKYISVLEYNKNNTYTLSFQ